MIKKFNLVWLIWSITEFAILSVVAGFCYSYHAGGQDDWKGVTISCVVGALITLGGSLRLGADVIGKKRVGAPMLLLRAFEITAGIVLIIVDYKLSLNLLAWSIAVFFTVLGVLLIGIAIYRLVSGRRGSLAAIGGLFLGLVCLAFGIVAIIVFANFYTESAWDEGVQVTLRIIGVAIGIYALVKLVIACFVYYKASKVQASVMDILSAPILSKKTEPEPVEAMVEDKEDPTK